jgi:hypothetical protein
VCDDDTEPPRWRSADTFAGPPLSCSPRPGYTAPMNRYAAMLLCAVVPAAVLAAPAPAPRTSGPWFDGWDKPVDPLGDCRFERKGGTDTQAR